MVSAAPVPKAVLSGPRELLPKDSEEYAASTMEELRFRWANVRDDERRFMAVLAEVLDARIYVRWPPNAPYGDINELCQTELGATLSEVRQTVATTAAERIQRAAGEATGRTRPVGRPSEKSSDSDDLTLIERASRNGIGRDAQQRLDYLARKAPHLLDEVRSGGKSVDAAYRLAKGKPKRITILMEPEAIAQAIRRHLNPEQVRRTADLLAE